MSRELRVIAVIPARGGSKGVPRKNIRLLGGIPLIGWTIRAALGAPSLDGVFVSTDDDEIAEVALTQGPVEIVRRPAHLGIDTIPVMPVVQNVIEQLGPRADSVDTVVVLQATNPFRGTGPIERALTTLADSGADCVISLAPVREHPFRVRALEGTKCVPLFESPLLYAQRQDLPPFYMFNGAVIAVRKDSLMRGKEFYGENVHGIVISEEEGFDIDTEMDLLIAEGMAGAHSE